MPLPPELQTLGRYKQFVNWSLVPANPKPLKMPVNVAGIRIDAHDPANWLTADQANAVEKSTGYGIAFVLSDQDPFAVIDLDHCRDETGTWSQLATSTCEYFNGAGVEVSQSGNGLHIWLMGKVPPGYKTKNQGIGLEIYSQKRMIALGNREVWGDAGQYDWTEHLNQFVPAYMEKNIDSDFTVGGDWTTEPRPEYTGPDDDAVLIVKMLASRTAANTFGTKASVQQLWTADPIALAEAFPDNSSDRPYDASGADLALATHLAFWTGGNCERIERLMWQSALRRDKWTQHKSYLRDRTILKAVAGCRSVYDFAMPTGKDNSSPSHISATPFQWINPHQLKPRQWLYGHALIRGFISLLVAPGASGKSTLLIGEALAMASGRELLGVPVYGGPKKVWLWNLEDPMDELQRRITASFIHFGLTGIDIGDRLFVDSGRDQPLCIATQNRSGFEILEPLVEELVAEIKQRKIDVLIIDPFVSSHQVPENDNGAIDAVAKAWARVADGTNCSILLVHHLRKLGGEAANAEAARGASALVAAARSVRVINRMSKNEAENAGLDSPNGYIKVFDDKNNMAPPDSERANWYFIRSVSLSNGDFVGVIEPWEWPELSPSLGLSEIQRIQSVISTGRYRESPQSPEWVGGIIGHTLGIDVSKKNEKRQVTKLIDKWVKAGFLKIAVGSDHTRKPRKFIEVGEWVEQTAPLNSSGVEHDGALIAHHTPPPPNL